MNYSFKTIRFMLINKCISMEKAIQQSPAYQTKNRRHKVLIAEYTKYRSFWAPALQGQDHPDSSYGKQSRQLE